MYVTKCCVFTNVMEQNKQATKHWEKGLLANTYVSLDSKFLKYTQHVYTVVGCFTTAECIYFTTLGHPCQTLTCLHLPSEKDERYTGGKLQLQHSMNEF